MKLAPSIIYTLYQPFHTHPRQNMVGRSCSIVGGSIRLYCSNTKGTDLDTPRDESDVPIPYVEGTYDLSPLWGYISYTPNADLWNIETSYDTNDTASYGGSVYKSLGDANVGNLPTDETKWVLVETPTMEIPDGLFEVKE